MKKYHITVKLEWVNAVEGGNVEEAIKQVKEIFKTEFDLDITNEEITEVEEQ